MENSSMPEGWLFKLANDLKQFYDQNNSNRTSLVGGPSRTSAYISC